MTQKTLAAEEKAKREKRRYVALKNLKEKPLLNLATAYIAQTKDSGFGETDNASVEEFLYFPALNSGTNFYNESGGKSDLIRNSLLSSRQDGRRYSGQVSEYNIINKSASIIQDSLTAIKVSDVMDLMGSKVSVDKKYSDKYVSDLLESKDEKDKEYATKLIGGYLQYLSTKGVSNALNQRANSLKGGLEELVKPEEK